MAQVPYSPVPDVVPTAPAAPKIGVSTPPQAFGITTAEAEQRLGGQAEQSANELAQTALYVQQLRNETWAKDAFVQSSGGLGDLEEGFRNKRGADAQAAYPEFKKSAMQLYRNAVANAPNPQAARFLGDALSRRVTYSIEDAGRHAGEQERQYINTTNINLAAAGQSAVAANPDSDKVFSQAMDNTLSAAATLARAAGEGPDGYSKRAEQLKSSLWEVRLHALGSDPTRIKDAIAMFNANKDQIQGITQSGETYQEKIKDWLNRQNLHYGVAQDAQTILEDLDRQTKPDLDETPGRKDLTPGQRAGAEPLPGAIPVESPEFLARAQEKARAIGKDQPDPNYGRELVNEVTSEYNRRKEAFMLQQNGIFANLASVITAGHVTSETAFKTSPLYADQIEQLATSASGKLKLERLYEMIRVQNNRGTADPITQEALVRELRGLSVKAEKDPAVRDEYFQRVGAAFSQVDEGRRNTLTSDMVHVQRTWANKKADPLSEANRVFNIMSILKPQLDSAGLRDDPSNQAVRSKYYQFAGALQQAIKAEEGRTGKQLSDDEIVKKIAPLVFQSVGGGAIGAAVKGNGGIGATPPKPVPTGLNPNPPPAAM